MHVQSPMEPPEEQSAPPPALGRRANYSYTDFPTDLSNQAPLFPTVIFWPHGGSHVEVEGSFDNWTTRQVRTLRCYLSSPISRMLCLTPEVW